MIAVIESLIHVADKPFLESLIFIGYGLFSSRQRAHYRRQKFVSVLEKMVIVGSEKIVTEMCILGIEE